VNAAPNRLRLPASAGGLVELAAHALLERAGLYALLSVAVLAVCAIVNAVWHAGSDVDELIKANVLTYVELFGLSYVIAVVALGVGTRATEERPASRTILEAGVVRYLPVLGTTLVLQLVVLYTLPLSGMGAVPEHPALLLVTAPVTWFVWGVLSLAGPYAALSADRPAIAIFGAFGHAIGAAFRPQNFTRLCLVALLSIVPNLLDDVLFDALVRHGVAASVASFWTSVPIDVLSVAPLAALQTVFALDFARRAAAQR